MNVIRTILLYGSVSVVLSQAVDIRPMLFFTSTTGIYAINMTGGPAVLISSFKTEAKFNHFIGIDFNWRTGNIYVVDSGQSTHSDTKHILRYHLSTSNGKYKDLPGRSGPVAVAVDVISNVVYFTDARSGHVVVYTGDLAYRRFLVTDLPDVKGIGIDPKKGMLFLTTSEGNPTAHGKIYSASMDGSSLNIIVSQNINWPQVLAIDRQAERLYWADTILSTIESCRYDGSQRTVIINLQKKTPFISLTLDDVHIYFSIANQDFIHRIPKAGGAQEKVGPEESVGVIREIVAVKQELQRLDTNPCSVSNGGCEQFCLPVAGGGRSCSCGDRFTLTANRQSCVEATFQTILLVTDKRRSGIYMVDLPSGAMFRMPLYNLREPTGLSWDPLTKTFIWSSQFYKRIGIACLFPQSCLTGIVRWPSQRHSLEDLAVDPFREHIYLVDAANSNIFRINYLEGEDKRTIVETGISTPRGLALDLTTRLMYWTEIEPVGKIRRASMDDGSGITTLIDTDIISPLDIVVDTPLGRMYWCDGGKHTIESSTLTGTDRKTLYKGNSVILSLTFNNDSIYFSEVSSRSLIQIDKRTGGNLWTFGPKIFLQVFDMVYIDKSWQPSEPPPPPPPITDSPPMVTTTSSTGGSTGNLSIIVPVVIVAALIIIVLVIVAGCVIHKRNNVGPDLSGRPQVATVTTDKAIPTQPHVESQYIQPIPSVRAPKLNKEDEEVYDTILDGSVLPQSQEPIQNLTDLKKTLDDEMNRNMDTTKQRLNDMQNRKDDGNDVYLVMRGYHQ